ncbi:pre-peptidase C-terminal domain-containing protein [bacterium]|nr:pre-peptidase C-terminal domain-containing protein [bacterium]
MSYLKKILLLLITLSLSTVFVSCDDGSSTDPTVCKSANDCEEGKEECKFTSLDADGVCIKLTSCEDNSDCVERGCNDAADEKKYCGFSEDAFKINPATLPQGLVGTAYDFQLELTGADLFYTFQLKDGSTLPAGLSLSANGKISGTPTEGANAHTFTVRAINGKADSKAFYNYKYDEITLNITIITDLCVNVTCQDNATCQEGDCVCDEEFHTDPNDDDVCAPNTLENQDCLNKNDIPTQATWKAEFENGLVDFTWNSETSLYEAPTCEWECNENYTGELCDQCEDGFHPIDGDDFACESNTKVVACTNVIPADGAWDEAFAGGQFTQTWDDSTSSYLPNISANSCLWSCVDAHEIQNSAKTECVCEDGYDDLGNGCVLGCPSYQYLGEDGSCHCYPGYAGETCSECADGFIVKTGRCVFDCSADSNSQPNTQNSACECKTGYFLNAETGKCDKPCLRADFAGCATNETCDDSAGIALCYCNESAGFMDDGSGACVCSDSNAEPNTGNTACICSTGFVKDIFGACVEDDGVCSLDTISQSGVDNGGLNSTSALAVLITPETYENLTTESATCTTVEDWYKIEVPNNKIIKVDLEFTHSRGNLDVRLYEDGFEDNYDYVASGATLTDNESISYRTNYTDGSESKTYFIRVYTGKNVYSLTYSLDDAPITETLEGGDVCADAVVIPSLGLYQGDTTGTVGDYSGSCGSSSGSPEVVYSFTPETSGELTVTLEGLGSFDSVLYIRTSCEETSTQISCKDTTTTEVIKFQATAGVTYFIFVDGYSTDRFGSYTLLLEMGEDLCAGITCDGHRVCNAGVCECDSANGYFDNGYVCVDPCSSYTCPSNSECVAGSAVEVTCECVEGYESFNNECIQVVVNSGADTCDVAQLSTPGIYSGTTIGATNSYGDCSGGDLGDLFYKLHFDTDVIFYAILDTDSWDGIIALFNAPEEGCGFTTETTLHCKDSYGTYSNDYIGTSSNGYIYPVVVPAGTYYLMVDGQSLYDYYDDDYIDHEGAFTLEFNYGAPCAVNSCNAEAHEYCLPTGFGDDDYECACDEENGYFELNGSCVNPCENESACPDETANGTNSCTPSSATEFTCGCQAGYFETVQDGIHSCVDPCSLPEAPDCSAEGTNVVCKSTSLENIFCTCETGYYDEDDTDTFSCLLAGPQGSDICSADATLIEIPADYVEEEWVVYLGDTTDATNNQTRSSGVDHTYLLRLEQPAIVEAWMRAESFDTTLYLKSTCDGTTTLYFNDDNSAYGTSTRNSAFTTSILNPGDYYLVLDAYSSLATAKGTYTLKLKFNVIEDICQTNPCDGVENSSCFLISDAEYECRCNTTDGYYDADDTEVVNCVNPCLEPEAPVCGEHSVCKSTSATAASCVCETGYFLSNGECVSPCETNPCLGVENSTEVCTATSATVYSCGCDEGSLFLLTNGVPSCVIPGGAGADICSAEAPVISTTGYWVGDTTDATNNQTKSSGKDHTYILRLSEPSIVEAWSRTETFDGTLYLKSVCDGTTTLFYSDDNSAYGTGTRNSAFTTTRLEAGDYYLVQDAYTSGNGGTYRLYVNITPYQDLCADNPCLGVENSDEVCTQTSISTYTCGCNTGYYADNQLHTCENPCDLDPCLAVENGTGVCTASSATAYSCECSEGYYANNTEHTCSSPCEENPCLGLENSTEVCTATSLTVFTCGCDDGAVYKVVNGNPACVLPGPTGTDTCVDSPVINSSGLWVGTTVDATNDYNAGSGGCTGFNTNGVDVTYQITMAAGDQLSLSLARTTTSVDMALYIVTDCSDVFTSCVEGVDGGNPETLTYTAEADGVYFIIVDAYTSSNSAYTYELTVNYTPTEPDPCGDGVIDYDNGEECDPAAADPFDGITCMDLGFFDGTPTCNASCQIETSSCL